MDDIEWIYCIDKTGQYCQLTVLPDGATEVPQRPSEFHEYVNGAWNLNLDAMRFPRSAAIRAACAAAIVGGFQSTALGGKKPYTYGSSSTDQANLSANVMASMYPGLAADWTTPQLCADAKGAWDYRPHTAAQIQQVGSDAKAAIKACLDKRAQLQAKIDAATNADDVGAIVW